jgi:hypothetical protein
MSKRKQTTRGQRKHGPRTKDGARRGDKAAFGNTQWMRRYRDRYQAAA